MLVLARFRARLTNNHLRSRVALAPSSLLRVLGLVRLRLKVMGFLQVVCREKAALLAGLEVSDSSAEPLQKAT